MFLRNAWYVGAWSNELVQDKLLPRTLLDDPIVFFRTQTGTAAALFDRCPHRFAPLSRGSPQNLPNAYIISVPFLGNSSGCLAGPLETPKASCGAKKRLWELKGEQI